MAQDESQAEAVKEVASSPCLCEERVLCAIGVAGSRAGSVAPRPCGHQPNLVGHRAFGVEWHQKPLTTLSVSVIPVSMMM